MKLGKIINLMIIFVILASTHYFSYATGETLDTDVTSSEFLNNFNPEGDTSDEVDGIVTPFANTIIEFVNPILGVLQFIGGVLMTISIAVFGFNKTLKSNNLISNSLGIGGNPEEGVKMTSLLVGLIIGSALLFFGSTFVKLMCKILIL